MSITGITKSLEWLESLDPKRQEEIKTECPDSWKTNMIDYYTWVADKYSTDIQTFLKDKCPVCASPNIRGFTRRGCNKCGHFWSHNPNG